MTCPASPRPSPRWVLTTLRSIHPWPHSVDEEIEASSPKVSRAVSRGPGSASGPLWLHGLCSCLQPPRQVRAREHAGPDFSLCSAPPCTSGAPVSRPCSCSATSPLSWVMKSWAQPADLSSENALVAAGTSARHLISHGAHDGEMGLGPRLAGGLSCQP